MKRAENRHSWDPEVVICPSFHDGLFTKPTEAEKAEKRRSVNSDLMTIEMFPFHHGKGQRKTGAVVMAIPAILPSVTSPLSRKPAPSDMAATRRHSAGSFVLCPLSRPEKNRSRGGDDSSRPSFRHQPLSRKPAPSDMAANICHSAGSFFLRGWVLCRGTRVEKRGGGGGSVAAREQKVILQCPVTADVNQTKQSVMIKVFSSSSHGAEEVLGCDWLSRLGKFYCPSSLFQAELIDIHNDSVLASLPKHRLQKGDYRCQLVPYDRDQPFTDCTITEPEETITESQVTPTTAVHHETDEKKNSDLSNGPQEKSFACSADDRRGLVAAVVVLTITVFCLLMAMAAMVIYHLRCRRHRYPRYKESPQDVLEAL
ncbi:hypothetical protein ACOMHN_009774 [Nucella lapillus]